MKPIRLFTVALHEKYFFTEEAKTASSPKS